ncbi:MAG: hypothetical protein ACRDGB_01150, partial [Candidatus Limnocylindria bacterium]
ALDQPLAGGYSAVHGVPPLRFSDFRFGDYAVFNFSSTPETSPPRQLRTLDQEIKGSNPSGQQYRTMLRRAPR